MPPKFNRSKTPGGPSRLSSWHVLLAVVTVAAPAIVYVALAPRSARRLAYGEFKSALEKGEFRSVRVGPSWITGEYRSPQQGDQALRFQTSRLGMDRDPELYTLLKKHVPGGAYEAEAGPSLAQTVLLPSVML